VTAFLSQQQHWIWQLDSLLPVSEGFVGDPLLSNLLTLCHISHFGSQWLVLDHLINKRKDYQDNQQSLWCSKTGAYTSSHQASLAREPIGMLPAGAAAG
jgi:hypothetical protein